jgi:hypothetical protein
MLLWTTPILPLIVIICSTTKEIVGTLPVLHKFYMNGNYTGLQRGERSNDDIEFYCIQKTSGDDFDSYV